MTEQYQARKPSIVDKITPLQCEAWELEHRTILAVKDGKLEAAGYLQHEASNLRFLDTHNKIEELFDRSDQQNAILDGVASIQLRGEIVSVFAASTSYNQGRDYSDEVNYELMQQ